MSSKDGKSGRLPTFKAARDLTLGSRTLPGSGNPNIGGRNRQIMLGSGSALKKAGIPSILGSGVNSATTGDSANKKKFTPNLNVQRRQPTSENAQKIGQESSSPHRRSGQASGSPSKREQRKPFIRPDLIQTMGAVFSEGFGEGRGGIRRSRFGGGGTRNGENESSTAMQKPKLNLHSNIDKATEAERLKELLRDDFIDDLTQGPLVPVQLPMIDTGTAFKEEDCKDNISIKEEVKGEKSKNSRRILDSDDESDDSDSKNKIKQEQEYATSNKSVISKNPPTKKSEIGKTSNMTFSDLVKMQKGDLLFVQLPDHLPGNLPVTQAVNQDNIFSSTNVAEERMDVNESNEISQKTTCTLNVLPEGYLGKIQIRKSGKTQLLIGDTALDIDLGAQVGFLQDLVAINVPTEESDSQEQTHAPEKVGDMTVLGHVRHRIVVSPDWERLFDLSEKQSKFHSGNSQFNGSSSDTSDDEIYN